MVMSRSKSCGRPPLGKTFTWLYSFVMTIMPFIMPYWGWQFWYLRPFIMYASILPYLFAPVAFLSSLPCQLCAMLGILDKSKTVLSRYIFKFLWTPYMRIWHGYEVIGFENLPPKGKGGLIVFYHGVIPMDTCFLAAVVSERQGRLLGGTVHRFILNLPLLGSLLRTFNFSADGREKMIEDLKQGELRAVAPGGDYETIFSENYSVEFGKRCGFAVAAKKAGVPIIPMFTENIREYQRIHFFGIKGFYEYMQREYGNGVLWAFGGLPVKLRTHLGKPMLCGENETPEDFAKRVKKAIEDLRDAHQKLDNSMIRALKDRFRSSEPYGKWMSEMTQILSFLILPSIILGMTADSYLSYWRHPAQDSPDRSL